MYLTFNDWMNLVAYLSVAAWITYAFSQCVNAGISYYEENL